MKHFRINFFLCLACIILLTAVTTLCIYAGNYTLAIIMALPLAIVTILLCRLVWNLIFSMSYFATSLEMNDPTFRLSHSDDPDINRMSHAMSRISDIYKSGRYELETRKLYYDRILRVMTHEMRNAIAPIVSLSTDMQENPENYQGDNFNEAVSLISDESQGIRRFLDSYHELTHLPKPKLEKINVKDFFSNIQKSFSILLSDMNLPTDLINYTIPVEMTVNADKNLLNRMVTNILKNAVEAVAAVPSPRIDVNVSISEGLPYISIVDNGPGIPQEVMHDLFQPFLTTKPGGSGIGLCLSRQIARLHGGDFTLTSTPGHGTKALISLT